MQTLMTLFTDSGFTYTLPWLTALCNDLQIHVDRKDAAFAAEDEAKPNAAFAGPAEPEPLHAPKPAAKPAKPAKAERSPFCDSFLCCGRVCPCSQSALVRSALRRRSPRRSRASSGSTSSARRSPKRASGPDAGGLPHSR